MALSPISPQELFLQPISSDTEAGQQQVRKGTIISKQPLSQQLRLRAVVPNLFDLQPFYHKAFSSCHLSGPQFKKQQIFHLRLF